MRRPTWTISRATLDLIIASVAAIVLFLLASIYDANDRFVAWSSHFEDYELDEIPVALSAMAIAFGWYAYRRWRENSAVANHAADANRQLTREIEERKSAEAALHQNEQRFRDFAEASADWFWEINAENQFVYVSPNVERIIGVKPDAYYGHGPQDIDRHEFDLDVWAVYEEHYRQRKPFRDFLYRRTLPDGEIRWLRSSANPRFGEDGEFLGYRGSTSDVSDAVHAEGALRESEERYRRLVELSPDGIILHARGRLVFANPAALRLLGAENDQEILGMRTVDFIRRDFRRAFLSRTERVMSHGLVESETEHVMLTVDSQEVPVESSSTPILYEGGSAVLIVFRDISERRKASAALTQQKSLFESIFRSVPDAVVVAGLDHRIRMCNPGVTRVFGYSPKEIIGQKAATLYESRREFERLGNLQTDTDTQDGPHLDEGTFRRKSGEPFPADVVCSVIRDADGEPIGFIDLIRDITGRKHAESEQATLQEQIHQSQKLESLGTLAGGIAHDFNNLLAIINGYGELVIDDLETDSTVRKNAEEILAAGRRAEDLVQQILAYSRNDRREFKPLRLDLVLNENLGMLRATLPATITIQDDIPKNQSLVLADPTQMHQVVMNLCVNAGHAIGKTPGELKIRLRNRSVGGGRDGNLKPLLDEWPGNLRRIDELPNHRGGRMWIGRLRPGRYAVVTVQDNGCGMSYTTLQRVFDPFFTTKGVGDGTGLGLSSVEGIVRSHDGAILLETEAGKGTRFDVFLPVDDQPTETPLSESRSKSKGGERILLVDDDDALLQSIRAGLERLGYDVTAMADGASALDAFHSTPQEWDLVVADQVMPGLSGVDLAKQILTIRPEIPVILCTGLIDSATRTSAEAVGVREFHIKPLLSSELADCARRILDASEQTSQGVA